MGYGNLAGCGCNSNPGYGALGYSPYWYAEQDMHTVSATDEVLVPTTPGGGLAIEEEEPAGLMDTIMDVVEERPILTAAAVIGALLLFTR
jgi:hypothetical protein